MKWFFRRINLDVYHIMEALLLYKHFQAFISIYTSVDVIYFLSELHNSFKLFNKTPANGNYTKTKF